ncbi:MAG: hypothetical protein JF591_21790 [Lysobacter sp.]|nr:hypothetical protein [Lysobacter sp.]
MHHIAFTRIAALDATVMSCCVEMTARAIEFDVIEGGMRCVRLGFLVRVGGAMMRMCNVAQVLLIEWR